MMRKRRRSAHQVFMTQAKVRALLKAYREKVYWDQLAESFLKAGSVASWIEQTRDMYFRELTDDNDHL